MHPTLLQFGDFRLATYGALVAAAYLAGILWLRSQMGRMNLDEDAFWRLVYYLFFGAFAGGKLLYVLVEWRAFASGELHLLRDIRYGFVFFGGLLGAMAMGALYVRGAGASYLRLADPFAAALPMGHAIGRLGCLAAGCCYGRPTGLPWGVRFTDPLCLVEPGLRGLDLHPTQLYEAVGCAAVAAALLRLLRRVQAGELREGTVLFAYMLAYSVLRFGIEFLRGDDRGGFLWGMSPSQWLGLAVAASAAAAIRLRGLRAGGPGGALSGPAS